MSGSDITVLLVDDDEDAAALVRDYVHLRYDDIVVRTVASSDAALTFLEERDDVDCVVSDYEMPSVNGLELLEIVGERWPDLPFILFTAWGDEDVAIRAIRKGVTDYLQKRTGTSQYPLLVNRIRDVVGKRRAEMELKQMVRRTEVQFDLLVDTIEDYAIFFIDRDGYVQTWNKGAENIKGYTAAEIVGEHFSVFYRQEDVEAGVPDQNLRRASEEGRTSEESWRVRKDGSEFWADVTITELREDGELLGYAKVTHDATQRKSERELLEQKEQLEHFFAAISHDLRTPLSIVEGRIRLANETGDLSHLDGAATALERANDLLDHISRLVAEGRPVAEPEMVDLREVTEAAWLGAETEGSTLHVERDATVRADRQRLQQLLENLLRNAVDHAGPDVTVTVGSLEGGFFVADDGPGIPEDGRSRIFEMGHAIDSDSTGYGLAICKQIADAHGWFIEATTGADGGARFEVTGIEMEDPVDSRP